jgi:hypothetical protein
MAEPEVEAAWRAEFKRIGDTQVRDVLNRQRHSRRLCSRLPDIGGLSFRTSVRGRTNLRRR